MSLNDAQRARTASELAANLAASGLTRDELRLRSGLSSERFEAAFGVTPHGHPADVWLVRDVVETAVRDAGARLTPFSVLTDGARAAAAGWFGVTDRR